ncbi:O-methyltransferase [Emticicia sp. TH156]|uniref:O-methyltransferase n=1 Tax=Emticicia sp. TH156 TaxID=2067454 RepID=UPI000C7792BF|nr:class I SAM-dependent methyltransferase [Emticicia sp. TH156]PLK42881.1 SAM-dependent methyltransferase [Emticicia sp. TH156]
MIFDYLKYIFSAGNEHDLHSPFLFDFYTKVLKNSETAEAFKAVEALRKSLLKDERTIEITDFGAGSKINKSNLRRIKDIARNSQKSPKLAQLFFRIIRYFNYNQIFDLGTSLGITTAYLATASSAAKVCTFEGCPQTAAVAIQNFEKLGITNVEIITGDLNETLQNQLQQTNQIDFAFFDANHRYEPTIDYFEKCLAKAHEDTCFVFDDIYWSEGMKKAWDYIKCHPRSTITIDIFYVGIVFFRCKQPKQHFILKF